MRIISGKFKGKRITAPKKLPVRPTTDMAKEALFNILNNQYSFSRIKVLDLFCGIGSISLEFASRGTTDITAVDAHYGCVGFVKNTAKELEVDIETIKSDVFNYLNKVGRTYDIIFADPPYDLNLEDFLRIPQLVFEHNLLENEKSVLIVEHANYTSLEEGKNYSHSRKYGSSIFSFFQLPADE